MVALCAIFRFFFFFLVYDDGTWRREKRRPEAEEIEEVEDDYAFDSHSKTISVQKAKARARIPRANPLLPKKKKKGFLSLSSPLSPK